MSPFLLEQDYREQNNKFDIVLYGKQILTEVDKLAVNTATTKKSNLVLDDLFNNKPKWEVAREFAASLQLVFLFFFFFRNCINFFFR
jgi:hypothetical protein